MSTADVILSDGSAPEEAGDALRESWRQVMSMRCSAQQFRARLTRTLPMVENGIATDEQFGDIATVIAVTVRILDWAIRDLDRLRLPGELFEVAPPHLIVRIATGRDGQPTATR